MAAVLFRCRSVVNKFFSGHRYHARRVRFPGHLRRLDRSRYELTASCSRGAAFLQQPLLLHPVQAFSQDPVVRSAKFQKSTGTFTIPARTTAVFIEPCFGLR